MEVLFFLFFFSIGGKGGVSHFHSLRVRNERENRWGLQMGRDHNPVWGLAAVDQQIKPSCAVLFSLNIKKVLFPS